MAVRFLQPPAGAGLTIDPTERFDFSGLSMLAQRAREAASIARERRTLRDLMGETQPEPEKGVVGGLKRVFGVGEEYQPISELERTMGKARIAERFPSPSDRLSLMMLQNLQRTIGGERGVEPAGEITPIGEEDITAVGGAPELRPPVEPAAPEVEPKPTLAPTVKPTATEKAPPQFLKIKTSQVDPATGLRKEVIKDNPAYKRWETRQAQKEKAALDIQTTWQREITKNRKTAMENFNAVSGLLQNTVAVWKAAAQEKEAKGLPKGIISKHTGKVAEAFDLPGLPHTKAYPGQQIETSMAMSKIITGGSRIIKSVINQLMKTLPTDNRRTPDMEAKIGQTFRNTFTRALGRQLKPQEQQYINAELRKLLATPPTQIPSEQAIAPRFKTFQVGGQNYKVPIEEVMDFINEPQFEGLEMYDITE